MRSLMGTHGVSMTVLYAIRKERDRAKIADRYKWNLADIYPDWEAWDRARVELDRLIGEVSLEVAGQGVGRLVSLGPVLLKRLHHDPVELAADQLRELGRLHVTLGRDRVHTSHDRRA